MLFAWISFKDRVIYELAGIFLFEVIRFCDYLGKI
jgi:hypothetical protein